MHCVRKIMLEDSRHNPSNYRRLKPLKRNYWLDNHIRVVTSFRPLYTRLVEQACYDTLV